MPRRPTPAGTARTAVIVLAALVATSCGASHTQARGYLVYAKHIDRADEGLWIARSDGSRPRLLVRHGFFGAVSPDGRWVAYNTCPQPNGRCGTANRPYALFVIPTSGGKPRLLADAMYPSWSPRSDRIAALRNGRLVSLTLDGDLRPLARNAGISGWSFSPDGKWIVYAEAQHTTCRSNLVIVPAGGGDERVLTRGRDIFPVWGKHWIAFSRYPASCAYRRAIWRVRPDGSAEQQLTAPPPASGAVGEYYGIDAVKWGPNDGVLLAGFATEWGDEAVRVDPATGTYRKLSLYAVDLSRDGRYALVEDGGVEPPHTIAAVDLVDGRRTVLVHGDVYLASWNR